MIERTALVLFSGIAIAALPACSGLPSLTTSSVAKAPAAPAPVASTPTDRALYVAATSARAQKCGYFFDPAKLRTNFLTAETQRGSTPEVVSKTGQAYDFTARTIAGKITSADAYCTKERTTRIRTALNKTLAGNFEPPPKKAPKDDGGFFADWASDKKEDKFDKEKLFDPNSYD